MTYVLVLVRVRVLVLVLVLVLLKGIVVHLLQQWAFPSNFSCLHASPRAKQVCV